MANLEMVGTKCYDCAGTGAGAKKCGQAVAGPCCRCAGKGFQTPEDAARNIAYDGFAAARMMRADIARATREDAPVAPATVSKGSRITVVKGRKVAHGTTGVCIWVGYGKFGTRVGLKDAAGTVHWTAITNVVAG